MPDIFDQIQPDEIKGDIFDQIAPTPPPSFRTEVAGPIIQGLNTAAFGIPKAAMQYQVRRGTPGAQQALDFLYPEQQTVEGKALRIGSEVPAILFGGSAKVAGKIFQKAAPLAAKGILGKTAQGALSGLTYGATTAKPSIEEYGENVAINTLAGGVGGLALGVGQKAYKSFDSVAARINNSLIKPKSRDLLYGNPGQGIAREGIVSNSLDDLSFKIKEKLNVLRDNLDNVYKTNSQKSSNYSKALTPIYNLRAELVKNPRSNSAAIKRLDDIVSDVTGISVGKFRKFNNLSPIDARVLKQDISDFIDWSLSGARDKEINVALKRAYGSIDASLDNVIPEAKVLNKRLTDLINADKAVADRIRATQSQEPFPTIFNILDLPFKTLRQPIVKTGLASSLARKYPKEGQSISQSQKLREALGRYYGSPVKAFGKTLIK